MAGRQQAIGSCDGCKRDFHYYLIHNGFNDSYYAYCDRCGRTSILDVYAPNFPKIVGKHGFGRIPPELEPHVKPCECGGHLRVEAGPRCPECGRLLSALEAASYIEKNAAGNKKGWRWQKNWSGIYCIVIEEHTVSNNFK